MPNLCINLLRRIRLLIFILKTKLLAIILLNVGKKKTGKKNTVIKTQKKKTQEKKDTKYM